jgi:hypothetical protein
MVLKKGALLGGVLSVLVGLVTSGCGGGEALSKAQYASKLSAMCEDFSQREKKIGEPQNLADLVEKGPRILDAFDRSIVDRVHKLKAPDEIADQADRLANLADLQHDVLAGLIAAAKDNDLAKVRELDARNKALNKEAESVSRDLGAKACAEG